MIASKEEDFALPLLDQVNVLNHYLQQTCKIKPSAGITKKKVCAYLGYRLLSYSLLPILTNAISTFVCLVLMLITLPARYCKKELNDYFWEHLKDSLGFLLSNIFFDLTCDLRQLGRLCGCPQAVVEI